MRLKTGLKVGSLGAIVFLVTTVNTMLFPVFPSMRSALDLTLSQVSLLVVFANVPAALFSPIGGILADRFSRKTVILPSLFLFGAGGLASGLAPLALSNPFPYMLGARIAQGIGAAAPMYLAMALAGDIFHSTERTRAIGLMEASSGLGKLLAPIIGALAGLAAWVAPFFLFPIMTLPIAAAVYWSIEEPPSSDPGPSGLETLADIKKPLSKRPTLLGLVAALYSLFTLIGMMFWLSEALEERIAAGQMIKGVIISLPVMTFLLTTLFAEYFYRRLKLKGTISAGLVLTALAIALIPPFRDTFYIWPVIGITGMGLGMVTPAVDTLSISMCSAKHRGALTTVYGGVRCTGAAAGPFTIALLMKQGPYITFWPIAFLGIAFAALVFVFLRDKDVPGKLEEK